MARLDLSAGAGGKRLICTVVLSRRNLLTLLGKLEGHPAGSKRRIENSDCWREGEPVDDVILVLLAEEDAEHYGRRPAPPGPMHPETERFVATHGGYTEGPQG
jgi:hypothetical protein